MTEIDNLLIDEYDDVKIIGRLISPKNSGKGKSPVVIYLTGDGPKGSKSLSWTNFPPRLEKYNVSSFLFDFEGLGYSTGERKDLSLTKAKKNLEAAYSYLCNHHKIDSSRICAFGSSFGAAALLASPKLANSLKLICLKSPAPILSEAYINEVGIERFQKWEENGYLDYIGYNFSVFEDSLKYDLIGLASEIQTQCFISQGTADNIVNPAHSLMLKAAWKGYCEIKLFQEASHGYGENNNWEMMAQYFEKIIIENI